MLHNAQEKEPSGRPVLMPSFMSPDQVSHYLSDLRAYRPLRPGGARPLAGKNNAASATTRERQSERQEKSAAEGPSRNRQSPDAAKRLSTTSRHSIGAQSLNELDGNQETTSQSNKDSNQKPPYRIPYYERGQRWMEKQEVHSLTRALQEMDTREGTREDSRVYAAAQQEAAQLMWKHQNPNAPYQNPDFDYRQHLRKGSHARSQSIGPFQELYVRKRASDDDLDVSNEGSRNVSSGSNETRSTQSTKSGTEGSVNSIGNSRSGSLRDRAMAGLSFTVEKNRRISGRRSSGRASRKTSDKSNTTPFSNPEDKIFEEPEDFIEPARAELQDTGRPLRAKARNTSYGQANSTGKARSSLKSSAPRGALVGNDTASTGPRLKNGIEVRSDDIRAATSMKLKDRSPRLPQPSVVSDRPGRPIISFDPAFDSKKRSINRSAEPRMSTASNSVSEKQEDIPTIQLDSVPSIAITPDGGASATMPSISIDEARSSQQKPKGMESSRPRPARVAAAMENRASHWSPDLTTRRQQAQCASCALGIQGKIVSAANERFHPECFTCYQCGELLECVAFYPEPRKARVERLMRHDAQKAGQDVSRNLEHAADENDGDPGLRFYCHLDFHERFSPRCRNCKTPIEGKVIVACGGEWHEGHFFCAECGDPFDQTTPFIEKDGYAWCVQCHTRRFSGKCAGCRKPITDMVINALDKEWHEECFCCRECGSQFEDGRFFTSPVNDKPVCVRCEERRLKA